MTGKFNEILWDSAVIHPGYVIIQRRCKVYLMYWLQGKWFGNIWLWRPATLCGHYCHLVDSAGTHGEREEVAGLCSFKDTMKVSGGFCIVTLTNIKTKLTTLFIYTIQCDTNRMATCCTPAVLKAFLDEQFSHISPSLSKSQFPNRLTILAFYTAMFQTPRVVHIMVYL